MSIVIGYKGEGFIQGLDVPMPTLTPKIAGAAYRSSNLRDEIYLDYVHYTIVMNRETKQLVFAASNINQDLEQSIPRGDSKGWDTDSRLVPEELQLDNRFYKNNDWDRGHMVQRNNNNWGKDRKEAIKANDDTFFYTNAAFQHKFFNQFVSVLADFRYNLQRLAVFAQPEFHLNSFKVY